VAELKAKLRACMSGRRRRRSLCPTPGVATIWSKKSVWGVGGDAGRTTSATAAGPRPCFQRNINLLVLNTQMYSNTGGQCSKATPMGSVALFAAGGKSVAKKDLGAIAMTYGNIYVAQVAMGYSDSQTVRAFAEAEAYDGPA